MPPEKGLLSCLSARSVQNQGSRHRAVRVYDAQHRALVSNDRAQFTQKERRKGSGGEMVLVAVRTDRRWAQNLLSLRSKGAGLRS